MPNLKNRLTASTLIAAAAFVAACGGSDGGTGVKTPALSVITIALTQSSIAIGQTATASATGVDQNGRSTPLGLLTYFNLATAIFDTPAFPATEARATVPSFNFADIFRIGQTGLTCNGVRCGIFTSSGNPVYPVQTIPLSGATFTNVASQIPGTSAVFYLLTTATAGVQTVRFTAPGGGALPAQSGMRLAILRVN